ncbi:MAG: UbiD family decarboxylase, partial [Chloroflexi bacterium]|nr:UbiD family decarboxylase [Chloroflexota bacterium]
IWNDLEALCIPGIRGVYAHPAAAGGFSMQVISLEQRYAGHAAQVLALAAQCPGGAYYSQWIVAVDEGVDPTDINQVIWAMSTRCNPSEDIDLLRQTWSTWLEPTQNPPDERPYGSKALINACKEHRYLPVFSRRSRLTREMYDRVAARWAQLGLPGTPPRPLAFEEEQAVTYHESAEMSRRGDAGRGGRGE